MNTIERTFFNRDITNVSLGYRSFISVFCCMMESIARLKGFSNVDNVVTAVIDDFFRRCEPFGDIVWLLNKPIHQSIDVNTMRRQCASNGYLEALRTLIRSVRNYYSSHASTSSMHNPYRNDAETDANGLVT